MATSSWRPARALSALLAQIKAAYPDRQSSYVGLIGNAAHAARASDHNPNSSGVVCALDVGFGVEDQDDQLVAALVGSRDPRIAYIISDRTQWRSYDKRLADGTLVKAWSPTRYLGSNPHITHVHVSVRQVAALYDDDRPWQVVPAAIQPGGAPDRPAGEPPLLAVAAPRSVSNRLWTKYLQEGLLREFPAYASPIASAGGADGIYGSVTATVVEEFQRRVGLEVDGVTGAKTWAALAKFGI